MLLTNKCTDEAMLTGEQVPLRKCKSKIEVCRRMSCGREVRYVCGNDGVSYRNLCELQEATCRYWTDV